MTYTDPLPPVQPPATPMPFGLLLDDGTECRLRNGGAWGSRDDGLAGAYGCPGETAVVVALQGRGRAGHRPFSPAADGQSWSTRSRRCPLPTTPHTR